MDDNKIEMPSESKTDQVMKMAFNDYVKPGLTNVAHDLLCSIVDVCGQAISASFDRMFYGTSAPPRSGNTNYHNISGGNRHLFIGQMGCNRNYPQPIDPRTVQPEDVGLRSVYDYQNVTVSNLQDAVKVRDYVNGLINQYGYARVSDFREVANFKTAPIDFKYEWRTPGVCRYRMLGGRYTFEFATEPTSVK